MPASSHLQRSGWDCILIINGYHVPNSQIVGTADINRTENDASLMTLTLLPDTGVIDIDFYQGKSITLDIQTVNGIKRIYTGVIDIPEIDLIAETITLRCTDRRTEQLNNQLPGLTDTIGLWSPHIFQTPRDTAEEVEQRLTTTPTAVDFDAYGNYTVTSWTPKATADFTLTDSDVYRNKPAVELTSRGRITNKIDIKFQYRYERFFHIERTFTWTSPINNDICLLLQYGYSLTPRAAVVAAIDAVGWPVVDGNITFTDIWPSGWYKCGSLQIGWSTVQLQGVNELVTDEGGNTVSDSSGNPLYSARITNATDYAAIYCMGATWKGSQQWAQNLTEEYTLSVQAPQSQTQFGTIQQDVQYAIDDPADIGNWEENVYYTSNNGMSSNYFIDQDTTRNEFNVAMNVALNQAKTTIVGSHRDTRVMVDTFIWPEIDLRHTVLVNTDEIVAKGKVFNIRHQINISTGEAVTSTTVVLSRSTGSASDSPLATPTIPSDTFSYNTGSLFLGNHFGDDPTTEAARNWNGMIGNRWKTENNNTFKTTYQEQFIVDTPAIPENQRQAKTLTASQSYDVEIPNDTLTITFDGKS